MIDSDWLEHRSAHNSCYAMRIFRAGRPTDDPQRSLGATCLGGALCSIARNYTFYLWTRFVPVPPPCRPQVARPSLATFRPKLERHGPRSCRIARGEPRRRRGERGPRRAFATALSMSYCCRPSRSADSHVQRSRRRRFVVFT